MKCPDAPQHEIDVAHQEKLCLSEIAGLISEDVIIENPELGEPYTGKTSIDGLFEQIGVRAGIKSFTTTILFDQRNGSFMPVPQESENGG